MRGLAAVPYCTREGGSGFIIDAVAPTLSTFDITQLSPVYDQTTGWLRQQSPAGNYSYYPKFSIPGAQPNPAKTASGDYFLRRSDVVAPMPSMTETARVTNPQTLRGCGAGSATSWIEENPWLAVGAALIGGLLLFGGKR